MHQPNYTVLQNLGVKMLLGSNIPIFVNFGSLIPNFWVIFQNCCSFLQKSTSKFEKVPFWALFGPPPPLTPAPKMFVIWPHTFYVMSFIASMRKTNLFYCVRGIFFDFPENSRFSVIIEKFRYNRKTPIFGKVEKYPPYTIK